MSGVDGRAPASGPGSVEFASEVRRLEPWWFTFEKDGHVFGGRVPRDADKVRVFFDWVERSGGRASTILELGSHEGSHSLQLAGRPGVERVLGLEGRPENLQRARFVQSVLGATNVEFRLSNLERFDATGLGSFDAVFCVGLLYHLPRPWALVEGVAPICRFLFLDTHYAPVEKVSVDRYRGCWRSEGRDALSGLSRRSFWLSFRHLMLLLLDNGFLVRFVRDYDRSRYGPRAWIFAERVGPKAVGCDWSASEVPSPLAAPPGSRSLLRTLARRLGLS